MCMPCDPNQPQYTVTNYTAGYVPGTTYIRICSDFAEAIWSRANYYHECGLRFLNFPCAGGWQSCGDNIVVPALFANAEQFLNALPSTFNQNGPYYMIVVNRTTLAPGELCFGGSSSLGIHLSIFFIIIYGVLALF